MDDRAGSAPTEVTALVWMGAGAFELRTLPAPLPAVDEVLVEVDLATVCGSDLHTVAGRRDAPCPSVLGHEAVGTVRGLGPGGRCDHLGEPLRVGDRVVWTVTASCGRCDRCLGGRTAKCRRLRKVGHEPLEGSWPLSGTYSTHVLLPAGVAIVPVPDGVSDAAAAPSACALATVMACVEASGAVQDRRFWVSGLGMLGLCACAVLAQRGASQIVAVDPDPRRRALAMEMGAHRCVAPGADPQVESDCALELSGAPEAVSDVLARVDVGGRVVLAGSVSPTGVVAWDPERIVRGHLSIVGVHNYEPRHLVEAVDFLARSRFGPRLAGLVDAPVPLGELQRCLVPGGPGALRASVRPLGAR